MTISANTLGLLMAAGLEGDELMAIVRSIEADTAPKARSSNAARTARYRERRGIPDREWSALCAIVKERDQYACTYCGSQEAPLAVDHVHPLILGGTNELDNLTTACAVCNGGKSGRTLGEFLGWE